MTDIQQPTPRCFFCEQLTDWRTALIVRGSVCCRDCHQDLLDCGTENVT